MLTTSRITEGLYRHTLLPLALPLVLSRKLIAENANSRGAPLGYANNSIVFGPEPVHAWGGDVNVAWIDDSNSLPGGAGIWVSSVRPDFNSQEPTVFYSGVEHPEVVAVGYKFRQKARGRKLHVQPADIFVRHAQFPVWVSPTDKTEQGRYFPIASPFIEAAVDLAKRGALRLYLNDTGISRALELRKLTRDELASIGKHELVDCNGEVLVFDFQPRPANKSVKVLPGDRAGYEMSGARIGFAQWWHYDSKDRVLWATDNGSLSIVDSVKYARFCNVPQISVLGPQRMINGNHVFLDWSQLDQFVFEPTTPRQYCVEIPDHGVKVGLDSLPRPDCDATVPFLELNSDKKSSYNPSSYFLLRGRIEDHFVLRDIAALTHSNLPVPHLIYSHNGTKWTYVHGFTKSFLAKLPTRKDATRNRQIARKKLADEVLAKYGTLPDAMDGSIHSITDVDMHCTLLQRLARGEISRLTDLRDAIFLAAGKTINELDYRPERLIPPGIKRLDDPLTQATYMEPAMPVDQYLREHSWHMLNQIYDGVGPLVGRIAMDEVAMMNLATDAIAGRK